MDVGSTNRVSTEGASSVAADVVSVELASTYPIVVAAIHAPAANAHTISANPAVFFI
jgi:hypothetical protein